MYYFISGYYCESARAPEAGISEPKTTFSACFGSSLSAIEPGKLCPRLFLGEKLKEHDVNVWLVNTGWTGIAPMEQGKE